MTTAPSFLQHEVELLLSTPHDQSADMGEHSRHAVQLSSSSWLDDIVLELIPISDKSRCLLRIASTSEFVEIVRCFRVGWQRISSHAAFVPPSKNSLDLYLAHWSSMLPLLVGFVARCNSVDVLSHFVSLTEVLVDALVAVTSRETQVKQPLTNAPLEQKLLASLLLDVVTTVKGYYIAQDVQRDDDEADDSENSFSRMGELIVGESLLVPPHKYLYTLHKLVRTTAAASSFLKNNVDADGQRIDNVFRELRDHANLVADRHAQTLMHTVIFPALYAERWTTSSAKYFGGRGVSHSVRFFFSSIITRTCSFLVNSAASDPNVVMYTAQATTFTAHRWFLTEYRRFLTRVGGEDAPNVRQLTPNRKQQLLVDIAFVVRATRWMRYLYDQVSQRPQVMQSTLHLLGAASAHAHPSLFLDAISRTKSHEAGGDTFSPTASSQGDETERVNQFHATVWNVDGAIQSWKELASSSPHSLACRVQHLETQDVCLPHPCDRVRSIFSDSKIESPHGINATLVQLLSPDERATLVGYCPE